MVTALNEGGKAAKRGGESEDLPSENSVSTSREGKTESVIY